eukprot:gene15505-32773_t
MPITKGSQALVAEASAQITTHSVADIQARLAAGDARLQLVDIRDVRELEREGTAIGALHAPRGMLEFWVDPDSPYHKKMFADEHKAFILFCGLGWRSALAAKALQDMGMTNVAHIDGGFADWVKQGAPVETLEQRKACCSRFLGTGVPAPDAEALMRSRYTAFVLGRVAYVLATWHASTRPATLDFDAGAKWLGLDVRRYVATDADHAVVEFVARYRVGGRAVRLHETSRFVREGGQWFYVDGDQQG